MNTRNLIFLLFMLLASGGCAAKQSVEPSVATTPVAHHTQPVAKEAAVAAEVPRPPFTLAQCLAMALHQNPDILGSGFNAQAARADRDSMAHTPAGKMP